MLRKIMTGSKWVCIFYLFGLSAFLTIDVIKFFMGKF